VAHNSRQKFSERLNRGLTGSSYIIIIISVAESGLWRAKWRQKMKKFTELNFILEPAEIMHM
jgi:hypothetical protein